MVKAAIPKLAAQSRKYVEKVLDFGFHNTSSAGMTKRLEAAFAEKFGVRFGIAHCNGTATMQSCLMAAGVGVGDEVIVPGLSMASTALVALHVNAIPVFADINAETFAISASDIERKVTSRTKAIIPVAIYGLSPDMDAIMDIARAHDLTVIEDNAQCFLGRYKGRMVGTLGHMASFSFQGSKHMTCGDGGIVLTDDESLAMRVRRACSLGYGAVSPKPGESTIPQELRCHPDFARHAEIGYNFRLPEIAAAVALGELERLDELVEMRIAVARTLAHVVDDCPWLIRQKTPDDCKNAYWALTARMTDDGPDWSEFRKRFVALGGDGFYGCWLPIYREPAFHNLSKAVEETPQRYPHLAGLLPDYRQVSCPVLERIQPRLVQFKTNCLSLEAAQHQADLLAQAIRSFD